MVDVIKDGRPSRGRFRERAFEPSYDTDADILNSFYIPILERAVRYDRSSGYFSSWGLAIAARGVARFISGGGTMRLLVGCKVSEDDAQALAGREDLPNSIVERLKASLLTADEFVAHRLGVLGWLIRQKRLEVRIAVATDEHGQPLVVENPYFHEKIGIAYDEAGDGIAFTGSANESVSGWQANLENVDIYTSWDNVPHYAAKVGQFERHWKGEMKRFRVYPMPDALRDHLILKAPAEHRPPLLDFEEPERAADKGMLSRFLLEAPLMPHAAALAVTTTGINPFPHQDKVQERLAGQYPRSWLVADEVGLGKTISAGIALRRLLLSGEVKKALILAPANVCRQWQDEMFEKFGLWLPVLGNGVITHADGRHDPVPAGANPFLMAPVLIASSHLARRKAWRPKVLEAGPYDLLVVDEAHHARRRGFQDIRSYDPNHLLRLLDEIRQRHVARAVWLLSATPMQVHPVELRDLLVQVGLDGAWADWSSFEHFFATLAEGSEDKDWRLVSRLLAAQFDVGVEPDRLLEQWLSSELDPWEVQAITGFHRDLDPIDTVHRLTGRALRALVRWARHHSPVGQLVTRHTRNTLRVYRDQGILKENVADRHVVVQPIEMTLDERQLYDELDDLITRLLKAKQEKVRGAGFVLTVYRRRLTSSWAAVARSFARRLEGQTIAVEDDLELDDVEDEDVPDGLPLTIEETEEMLRFKGRLEQIQAQDSKLTQLFEDLAQARERGDGAVVFTQYTDTLNAVRDALVGTFGSRLATFTGDGGHMFREGSWVPVAKSELVAAFQSGACEILLATDAASEGLNLQYVGTLINYDLPWNPMRVEQRIGRIDRIGQAFKQIEIVNYVIPDTVEDAVYHRLAERIELFHSALGAMQPILGAAEGEMQRVYEAPRAERAAQLALALSRLDEKQKQLERGGVELDEEDNMPLPILPAPPVDLAALRVAFQRDLGMEVTWPSLATTFDPALASRDPQNRTALATYGHPGLGVALEKLAAPLPLEAIARVDVDGSVAWFRADTVPPRQVFSPSDLGDVGVAVATGDATQDAHQVLARHIAMRQQRYESAARMAERKVVQRRRSDWERNVRRGVFARMRLAERTGDPGAVPTAALVYLQATEPAAWRPIDQAALMFGTSLNVVLENQFGSDVEDVLAARDPQTLQAMVDVATNELADLYHEIKAARAARR